MSKDADFNKWYIGMFGSFEGFDDEDNRAAILRIWNSILTEVAGRFEHNLFEELPGNQVADRILQMKASES